MVVEHQATRYVCEICHKDYSAREEAEDCEKRCQRYAELAELNKLNFSSRVFNLLYYAGLYSFGELEKLTDEEILAIKGFGRRSLLEVRDKLKEYRVQNNIG